MAGNGFAHGDVEGRIACAGHFGIEACAAVDQELDDGVGPAGCCAVQRSFARRIGLMQVLTVFEGELEGLERFGFGATRVLIAIADARGK